MGWKMTLLGGLAACCGALVDADQVASSGSSYLVSRPTKLGATATSWYEYGAVGVTTANVASGGSLAWSDTVGSGDTEIGGGNALDSAGNVYVVGSTRGNMTSNNANAGNFDWFILRYLPFGARSWTKQVGTPAHDEARTVIVTTEADGNERLHLRPWCHFGGRDLFSISTRRPPRPVSAYAPPSSLPTRALMAMPTFHFYADGKIQQPLGFAGADSKQLHANVQKLVAL
ncbi:hypothetical protein SDRG_08221 [Saprolegnia diclina VS20]|uniref:Thioredoxin domain-containing protein n=1 Tax=Saprolegnia diclina (strain VS20) TaxID=1156394 RepID=T0RNR4_SAPDV|nr:hypothetical protein SDRG_08221 [Saprolegnia diclina VS20]EQC34003.1 hypothetical protein SDRG_08221 [Saprolegnia diclina VS20]|eukprot:XP_008612315.1 hypothetical protein SDRG_08221 [Saprolegnia diclina VS20]